MNQDKPQPTGVSPTVKYFAASVSAILLATPAMADGLRIGPSAVFAVEGKSPYEFCTSSLGGLNLAIDCTASTARREVVTAVRMRDGEPVVLHLKAATRDLPAGLDVRGFMHTAEAGAYTIRPELACDGLGRAWPLQLYVARDGGPGFIAKLLARFGELVMSVSQPIKSAIPVIVMPNGTEVLAVVSATGVQRDEPRCDEPSAAWLGRQVLPPVGPSAQAPAANTTPDVLGRAR